MVASHMSQMDICCALQGQCCLAAPMAAIQISSLQAASRAAVGCLVTAAATSTAAAG